ncbi:hypothetical protein GGS26DRAFT_556620 [Hypomontagnella submonticulosa]|nr:hypothetical protein GGS26DRAFT_556620 [Hypomontagnella submonticulosa]
MQFKLSIVLLVAPFLVAATTHGNQVDDIAARDSVAIIDPSSFGLKVTEWTDLDDNWQFAVVHGNSSGGGHIAKRSTPLDWYRAHWGSTSPALVDKYTSRQACLGVGARFTGEVIRKNVGDACNAIIKKVPGATIADDGWTLLNRMGLTDTSAKPAYLQFVFAVLNNDVKPTVQLCQSAMDFLLGSACMQHDNSQGGLMAIGESFLVGFNPQDTGEQNL